MQFYSNLANVSLGETKHTHKHESSRDFEVIYTEIYMSISSLLKLQLLVNNSIKVVFLFLNVNNLATIV